jgi:AhpC/TSA family
MSLKERLDQIREQARKRIPPEAQAVMERATQDLRRSGMLERVVKVGQAAPEFTLPDTAGDPVSLAALRSRGPVVLSFYRGRW